MEAIRYEHSEHINKIERMLNTLKKINQSSRVSKVPVQYELFPLVSFIALDSTDDSVGLYRKYITLLYVVRSSQN
jgi:hypothetical protein